MATRLSELTKEKALEPTKALLEFLKKTKSNEELFDIPTKILLTVTFKLIPLVKNKVVTMKVPNGLKYENQDICLFVKDLKRGERDYEKSEVHFKELLANNGIKYINEVIPLKSLKLEYRSIEAKKNLSNKYDLFLADDRIFGNLPRTLGKDFARKKRMPIQVNLTVKDLKTKLDQAVNNAYMVVTGKGSCSMAHVANSNMTSDQIAENIVFAANVLAEVIPGGAENIRNIYIKSEDSPALPVYLAKPGNDMAQLPAKRKIPEKPEPEEIDWCLRSKAFVTENNEIYLSSKSGERKLFWGAADDFSNMPEKKKLLLRKKIRSLKKGKLGKLSSSSSKKSAIKKKNKKKMKPTNKTAEKQSKGKEEEMKKKKKQKNKMDDSKNKMAEEKKSLKKNGRPQEKSKKAKKSVVEEPKIKSPKSEKKENKNPKAEKKEKNKSPKSEKTIKKKKLKEKMTEIRSAKKSVKNFKK